jgi:hypothetical protein
MLPYHHKRVQKKKNTKKNSNISHYNITRLIFVPSTTAQVMHVNHESINPIKNRQNFLNFLLTIL